MPVQLHALLVTLLLLGLTACAATPGELAIVNSSSVEARVEGLPGGPIVIPPSETHRMLPGDKTLNLTVQLDDQQSRAKVSAPGPGGLALWDLGGAACFVHADYSAFYTEPVNRPASVAVIQILPMGAPPWTSSGPIARGPGERLPSRLPSSGAEAIVRIPCDAAATTELAQSWLEMSLEQIEPAK